MTMNESLHPRRNVSRLYIAKKEGRRLIRYKECVNVEEQSQDKYLSKEWMLKFVAAEKELSEVEDPNAFKNLLKEEKTSQWLENPIPWQIPKRCRVSKYRDIVSVVEGGISEERG